MSVRWSLTPFSSLLILVDKCGWLGGASVIVV